MAHATIDTLVAEIKSELIAAENRAMDKIEKLAPARVKMNFDASGKRGGNPAWPKVAFNWLVRRKSFPGGPTTLKDLHAARRARGDKALLTAEQDAYYRSAKPLMDTGALQKSIVVLERSRKGLAGAKAIIGSSLPYAEQQDQGIDGKIRARPFNHLVPEDLQAIDAIVESEFSK